MTSEEEIDELDQDEIPDEFAVKELVEYFRERLPLCSPADFDRLEERLMKEDDLRDLMYSARNLPEACQLGSAFVLAQIEYRAKTRSSVYAHIFGTRGMGKSEVAMSLAIIIIMSYREYAEVSPALGFGRSPSELNTKLAKATKKGKSLMLISDESEDESGTGSATEEQSLLGNLDTMRVLMHSVTRCSIPYRHGFGLRCDFILETILQDRTNRINYCVVYTPDPNTGKKKAKYLIDIPMHKDQNLRNAYEAWKEKEQKKFTSAGGRRSRLKERLAPFVDALVRMAEKEEESGVEITSWSQLEDILTFDIPNGDSLVSGESNKVMKRAFRILKKHKAGKRKVKVLKSYTGQITDLRKAVYDRMVERGVSPLEVDILKEWTKGLQSQTDIAHQYEMSQKDISKTTTRLRKNEMGFAFEDVYAEVLRPEFEAKGLIVKQGGLNTPLPDIEGVDKDGNTQVVYSVKCIWDRKTISLPRSEIAASELAFVDKVPVFLIMLDFVDSRLYDPIPITNQIAWTFTKKGEMKERFPS